MPRHHGRKCEKCPRLRVKNKKLKAENKRYKEVLEYIAKRKFCCCGGTPSHKIAEQALKGATPEKDLTNQ